MADATINGVPLLQAHVTESRVGAWTALVEADLDDTDGASITGQVVLDIDGEVFGGTVRQGEIDVSRWKGSIIGGRAGLDTVLEAKHYQQAILGDVLKDIARESGEVLSPKIPADVLSKRVPYWSRLQGEAHCALRLVADHFGVQWRILRDGTLWVGAESWLTVSADHVVEEDSPEERSARIAFTDIGERPVVYPGSTFEGQRVGQVVTELAAGALRQKLYFEADDRPAGFWQGIAAYIRQVVGPKLAYLRMYPGKVAGQSGQKIGILTDDLVAAGKFRSVDQIPMLFGIPGVLATTTNGARVRLLYQAGDPTRPVAALWDAGAAVDELSITVGSELRLGDDGATDAVALESKVHDAISLMLATGVGTTGTQAFAAAKTAWDSIFGAPTPGDPEPVGSSKVKAAD